MSSHLLARIFFVPCAVAAATHWVAFAVTPPWDPFFAAPAVVANFGAGTRPFGVAAGDFDSDGRVDLVIGRTTGNVAFAKGNGDGTFQAPVTFPWKQAFFNAWAFGAADVNNDGRLDVVWGANASSPSSAPFSVNDGEVRVFFGNGDGTFAESTYFVSGVRHNAGVLLADAGTDAGSLAAADVDRDGDADIVVGALDGTSTTIKLLRNFGGGLFTVETVLSQQAVSSLSSPIYFPATSTQNSPWGLSLSDTDGDGDADLWVGDRALYVYLFANDGSGVFTLRTGNGAVSGRPNVYLGHDVFRAAVGFTPSLASGDINGDGRADLVLGLQSGAQTPSSSTANDGSVLLDLSAGDTHTGFGAIADIGTMARGLSVVDVNGDTYADIVGASFDGEIAVMRQLTPIDSDNDGMSDYVDNAPGEANAPRIDLNTDGSVNHRDQLDNDADTVLGDPEQPATWQRLGDPADPDDDNDGVEDDADNCPFVHNPDQANGDADMFGAACDPVDTSDTDADGLPDGPVPGDHSYARALAAKIKWGSGSTRFVIRVDALGRFFQNEFTQLMTDAATLSPADWAAKCWENYEPGDVPGYQPCGTDDGAGGRALTLPGGKEVPITLVVIPKQLWTDPPVVSWINERNDNSLVEIGQHGTYHFSNTMLGDWKDLPDRNFFSCETCGLTEAESFELLKVGRDTLLGNYDNAWIRQSGAQADSPKIDWSSSSHPLISYAPPFNASDTTSREATAQLGFKGFSASVFEEQGFFSGVFSPEGSHHERFDQFGMFHASADVELEPPDTTGDTYAPAEYEAYLRSQTNDGGLTTWLIEEVEWSGRPCNNDDRLGTCNGGSNRENNTVYLPRWNAWMQLFDFVKSYPGGIALTMGEVALAQAFDNAPTVANADQTDADADGIGDAIEGAAVAPAAARLARNVAGTLSATLANGAGTPLEGQTLTFRFDEDGDGVEEAFTAVTDASGSASAAVVPTRPVGAASFSVSWDGVRLTADAAGSATIADVATLVIDPSSPASGQATDAVTVAATLLDSSDSPIAGRTVTFTIGAATGSAVTDTEGAVTTLVLTGPSADVMLTAAFAGDDLYAAAAAATAFSILREDTVLSLGDAVAHRNQSAVAVAELTEADGAPVAGRSIRFYVETRGGREVGRTLFGTAITGADGRASVTVPPHYLIRDRQRRIEAVFEADDTFAGAAAAAFAYRQH